MEKSLFPAESYACGVVKMKYLRNMGITVWRLRTGNSDQAVCYYLWDSQSEFRGSLVAHLKSSDSLAEEQLLAAILKSLRFNSQAAEWSEQLSARTLSLGSHPSARFQTHSLLEMLNEPLLKAKVWQDLQSFMRRI